MTGDRIAAALLDRPGIVTDYLCAYAYVDEDGTQRWGLAVNGNDVTLQGLQTVLSEDGRQRLAGMVGQLDEGES